MMQEPLQIRSTASGQLSRPCRRTLPRSGLVQDHLCDFWIKIGAKVVAHGRYVTFQLAEVAVSRKMFADILSLITRLRTAPAPA